MQAAAGRAVNITLPGNFGLFNLAGLLHPEPSPPMKKYLAPVGALLALLVLAGCESSGVTARIQEKSALFNSLEPWQQRDIQSGLVNPGFSTDMVYMALGKPSKIVTTADGQETIWTYSNYYPPVAQYQAQASADNSGGKYYGTVDSSSSPRNPASLSATGQKGTAQTSLDVPDLPADTLYVTFRNGQVTRTQLESEIQH